MAQIWRVFKCCVKEILVWFLREMEIPMSVLHPGGLDDLAIRCEHT